MNKFLNVIKASWLCLRFPFLYPRNRFDGKHHQYILYPLLSKLRVNSVVTFSVVIRQQPTDDDTYRHSYFSFLNNRVILKKDLGILIVQNNIERKEIKLKDIVNLEKFSVIGMEVTFSLSGTPIINLFVKTIDINDTSNYLLSTEKIELTTNKVYKFLYNVFTWIHEKIFDNIFILPSSTELDAMPSGWRNAFGIQMCKDIRKQLIKERFLFRYRITQIKEKFGTLRWYDITHSDEIQKIIDKYEELSWHTCIDCGKPATKYTTGWIFPFCDECFEKKK